MKSFVLKLLVLLFLFTIPVVIDAGCSHYDANKNCPHDTPCCNNGWCSNDPRFCSTGCEPQNSFSAQSCFPLPYCVNMYDDFESPKIVNAASFDGNPLNHDWTSDFQPDYASSANSNLVLGMHYDPEHPNAQGRYQGFGSTVSTTRWMQYGWVYAKIKTASTSLGVVSSFITKNLIGDEIDFEWVGLAPNEVQSNYYWEGALDYTHGQHHKVGDDSSANYHIYGIEWLPDHISWSLDGQVLRTLNIADTKASNGTFLFPSGPQRVQFSVWDGGMGLQGTSDWAGGPTDWSDKNHVYSMYVDWVNITCYYQGNQTTTWPPAGYGPPPNATTSSYATVGSGSPTLGGGGYGGSGNSGSGNIDTSSYTPSVPPAANFGMRLMDPLNTGLITAVFTSFLTCAVFIMHHLATHQ